jgi:hypothetical protein
MSSLQAVFVRFSGSPYPPTKLESLDPDKEARVAIMVRYLDMYTSVKRRARYYSVGFYTLRVCISLGSLIVPALLSLNQSVLLFWIIWILSLLVSISNSLIGIFRIDKKYFSLNALLKKLESEGWQFMNLTGNYYTVLDIGHDSQIQNFSFRIENIYMRHVDDEYRKNVEQNVQNITSQDTYIPMKQKSLSLVNAGPSTEAQQKKSDPKTKSEEREAETTVIEIAQKRSMDESK